jgi:AcrR family transcriptional regulator
MSSSRLQQARERERTRVMREVSAIAVHLFAERGYGNVRMEDVAEASGISVATLYRRFTTKENLVCWQADEQDGMTALLVAVSSGRRITEAAMDLAQTLPNEAVDAIEATARMRLKLIAGHASLQAAAKDKAESFVQDVLDASAEHDPRPLLERETETRCVAAALEAGNHAWLRGEGTLRDCSVRALRLLDWSLHVANGMR